MNYVTLTGTVATEPRARIGLDQPALAFRLAVGRPDDREPLHVDVVCPPQLCLCALILEPGDQLGVAGRLDHHDWVAQDGVRRNRWVVLARDLVVLRPATNAA